jgi:hypothetical protein
MKRIMVLVCLAATLNLVLPICQAEAGWRRARRSHRGQVTTSACSGGSCSAAR